MGSLSGQVVIVTGASRGAGKGIALVLGKAGATVYVTGRSTRRGGTTRGYPGTIDDTADAVTERGGVGIAVRCDHRVDADVEALFARVEREQGRLDLLVNNAYGGGEEEDLPEATPFWEQPLSSRWDNLFTSGLRSHIAAGMLAARTMIRRRRGLIITTSYWAYDRYMVNLFYDVAMTAYNRAAFAMAQDLRPHGVASIALAPGFMRTELVEARYHGDKSVLESTEYIGQAVVALAQSPDVMARSGRTLFVGDLAREYGFTDVDGRWFPPYASRTEPPKDERSSGNGG